MAAYVNDKGEPKVIQNRDGAYTTPSVVMFDCGEIVVGAQAKSNAVTEPYNVVQFVKRNMGDKEYSFETEDEKSYSAEEISAIILKRIREDCEAVLGEPVTQAVICMRLRTAKTMILIPAKTMRWITPITKRMTS